MKLATFLSISIILVVFSNSCSSDPDSKSGQEQTETTSPDMTDSEPKTLEEAEANWENNYGVGPIAAFELPAGIDQSMADRGKGIYELKCTACHKPDKKFIGPPPIGILENRTPAWVMNMILNPDEMVKEDPIAKQLLIKFNGSPMANQNLEEDEARAILEYFRTLKETS